MDLLVIIIIIMIFAAQNEELDLGGRIKRMFEKNQKTTGGLRPDADYGNVRPATAEQDAGDSSSSDAADADQEAAKETGKKAAYAEAFSETGEKKESG